MFLLMIWNKERKPGWLFFISVSLLLLQQSCSQSPIDNLEGKAGFRMASLRWSFPHHLKGPINFRIRYCELHSWGLHRCRYQTVDELTARTGRQETSQDDQGEQNNFIADIGGLRMSTNYSFQVVPQDLGEKFGAKPSQISLQTKGFSAKATKCLADSSEVSVETGPFFGGRISVEDSSTPGCYIKGTQSSPQTKYTLRIRHKECGSIIDGSKITSVIVVQENMPILTHSTRRFVVVCSISPDSFTVKAGVSLPRETSVAKSLDFNRIVRLAPQASNTLGENHQSERESHHQNSIPTNLQDDTQFYVSHLYAEKHPLAESRAFSEGLYKDSWEPFLVFGMICAAIVCSMVAVIWFVRSYRNINAAHEETIRRITAEDGSDTGSTISYDTPSSSNASNNDNSDVELDFEFSEDINRSQDPSRSSITNTNTNAVVEANGPEVTLNINSQNFSYV